MSDQKQLDNTSEIGDNENVPSESNINAELKEIEFSGEDLDRLEVRLENKGLKQAGKEGLEQVPAKCLEPEQKEGLEPEQKEGLEPDLKEGLEPDLKEGLEPDLKEGLEPDLKEGLEPEQKEGLEPEQKEHAQWAPKVESEPKQEGNRVSEEDKDLTPENVGPEIEPMHPDPNKNSKQKSTIAKCGVAAVVILIAIALSPCLDWLNETPSSDFRSALQIFQDKFNSLQNNFPQQNPYLWLRSEKMLRNHLNTSQPFEPATLILTAAQDAKHTLLCLAGGLAQAYAAARNASWMVIHGPDESKFDDSTAKLHIDEDLSSGFQSHYRAAVLNRLETLPPGSLLILYKYCDHENAAYKNVALVFTVLLEDSSLEPDISLPELEENVRDFLWQKFISSSTVRSHKEMDSDKLGGVWSRISHLVLPVLPVESIELGICPIYHKEH